MRAFAVTIDYKLSGDGSSSLKELIARTDDLAHSANQQGIILSIFVECLEFIQMQIHDKPLRQALGFSPFELVENQLRRLAADGHELHLHLHPNWLFAEFHNGHWVLPSRPVRVSELPNLLVESDAHREIAAQGISWLNRLRSESRQNALGFRAGYWSIQPEARVLELLRQWRVDFDSTVIPFAVKNGSYPYDFRRSPPSCAWRIFDNLLTEAASHENSLFEIPISSAPLSGWNGLARRLGNRLSGLISIDIRATTRYSADFYLRSRSDLSRLVEYQRLRSSECGTVLVFIGHPKSRLHKEEQTIGNRLTWLRSLMDKTNLAPMGIGQIAGQFAMPGGSFGQSLS